MHVVVVAANYTLSTLCTHLTNFFMILYPINARKFCSIAFTKCLMLIMKGKLLTLNLNYPSNSAYVHKRKVELIKKLVSDT